MIQVSPYILGIHGLPGAGKDTMADYLCQEYGFIKLAFADPLYIEVSRAFNISVEALRGRETKEQPTMRLAFKRCADIRFVSAMRRHLREENEDTLMRAPRSPRQVLQWWGTEFRRRSDPNYWTNRMRDYIDKLPGGTRLVIPDVRFADEATVVLTYPHLADGVDYTNTHRGIVMLVRPGISPSNHLSDQRLPLGLIKQVITNDKDLSEFYLSIDETMRCVFKNVGKMQSLVVDT